MKRIIERAKAKELIVKSQYNRLENHKKLEILESGYPHLDDADDIDEFIKDGDLPQLDEEIIALIKSKEYLKIPFHKGLDPLFIEYLMSDLYGVTNAYLVVLLNDRKVIYEVTGEIDQLGICPCCLYHAIGYGEDAFHDICSICFWENGGIGPNGIPLEEAQENFKKLGAMDASSLQFIDPAGKVKYKRNV